MAKYIEPHEDTMALYNKAIDAADLDNYINITIVVNDQSKDIFKVVKANDLLRFRTKDDVIIVINEKVLDQLTPEQRTIVIDESLASIHYDTENQKLVITKPDVVTYSGVLSKYTFETWNVLRESIKTIYQKEKQAEDESKAATEKASKKKKF